jgi:hypothetical protein
MDQDQVDSLPESRRSRRIFGEQKPNQTNIQSVQLAPNIWNPAASKIWKAGPFAQEGWFGSELRSPAKMTGRSETNGPLINSLVCAAWISGLKVSSTPARCL